MGTGAESSVYTACRGLSQRTRPTGRRKMALTGRLLAPSPDGAHGPRSPGGKSHRHLGHAAQYAADQDEDRSGQSFADGA
jgi:hypothetical protein